MKRDKTRERENLCSHQVEKFVFLPQFGIILVTISLLSKSVLGWTVLQYKNIYETMKCQPPVLLGRVVNLFEMSACLWYGDMKSDLHKCWKVREQFCSAFP